MISACGSSKGSPKAFSPAGTARPIKDAPLALGEDALDQRLIVVDPGAPAHRRDPGKVGQPFDGFLQRRLGGAGGGNQFAIKLAPFVFAAAVFDRPRALLGQAPTIAPQ